MPRKCHTAVLPPTDTINSLQRPCFTAHVAHIASLSGRAKPDVHTAASRLQSGSPSRPLMEYNCVCNMCQSLCECQACSNGVKVCSENVCVGTRQGTELHMTQLRMAKVSMSASSCWYVCSAYAQGRNAARHTHVLEHHQPHFCTRALKIRFEQ